MPNKLAPTFPKIPASQPDVVPPKQQVTYDEWFCTALQVRRVGVNTYDLEAFWTLGNKDSLSEKSTNNIVRNVIDPASLEAQLGKDFLDANPEVLALMPQLLGVLAKIAHQQGVL